MNQNNIDDIIILVYRIINDLDYANIQVISPINFDKLSNMHSYKIKLIITILNNILIFHEKDLHSSFLSNCALL